PMLQASRTALPGALPALFKEVSRTGTALERQKDGDRYCEVVQRREGLRFHYTGWRRERRVRPSHRDPDGGVPQPRRGSEGGVRSDGGTEGPAGGERPEGLTRDSEQFPGNARCTAVPGVFVPLVDRAVPQEVQAQPRSPDLIV